MRLAGHAQVYKGQVWWRDRDIYAYKHTLKVQPVPDVEQLTFRHRHAGLLMFLQDVSAKLGTLPKAVAKSRVHERRAFAE